jgi:hypothetical protein
VSIRLDAWLAYFGASEATIFRSVGRHAVGPKTEQFQLAMRGAARIANGGGKLFAGEILLA